MIASFPMYDRPETRALWDALWHAMRDGARGHAAAPELAPDLAPDLPRDLTWDADACAHWLRDDLVLSQTCSLPYRTRLHGKVTLLGAFDFGLPGCAPGYYNSVLVMRRSDPRHALENWPDLTLAYNAPDSQSGWAAPYFHLRARGLSFKAGLETGAHHASAVAVGDTRADIAALDAQTFALLGQFEPDLMANLTEVARTTPTPGLPLITRRGWDVSARGPDLDTLRDARLRPIRDALGLKSFVAISPETYLDLPVPPEPDTVFAA